MVGCSRAREEAGSLLPHNIAVAQAGSLFSPGGRHAPPVPFRDYWPGLCIRAGSLHTPISLQASWGAGPRPSLAHSTAHPPRGQLWCIVVALHVLAVPVQCFHSASQRPVQPSRDFPLLPPPIPPALVVDRPSPQGHGGSGEGGVHTAGSAASWEERGVAWRGRTGPVLGGQTLSPSLEFGPRQAG